MFKALASFWIMIASFISGLTKIAEAFDEVSSIAKDGAVNLRTEMQLEAIASRKALIQRQHLNESDVKEANLLTTVPKEAA